MVTVVCRVPQSLFLGQQLWQNQGKTQGDRVHLNASVVVGAVCSVPQGSIFGSAALAESESNSRLVGTLEMH